MNLSKMLIKNDMDTYSDDFKMNPGFHIGATVEFPISNILSLGTGLLLDTKGFKTKEEGQDWVEKEKLNLYYLDIPIV
ncbi:MAG: outer membrane beta-barrel protein [Cyclobacteriaceae bacterium]